MCGRATRHSIDRERGGGVVQLIQHVPDAYPDSNHREISVCERCSHQRVGLMYQPSADAIRRRSDVEGLAHRERGSGLGGWRRGVRDGLHRGATTKQQDQEQASHLPLSIYSTQVPAPRCLA